MSSACLANPRMQGHPEWRLNSAFRGVAVLLSTAAVILSVVVAGALPSVAGAGRVDHGHADPFTYHSAADAAVSMVEGSISSNSHEPPALVGARGIVALGPLVRPSHQLVAPSGAPVSSLPSPADAADLIRPATPVGSALKNDALHRAAVFGIDDVATNGCPRIGSR